MSDTTTPVKPGYQTTEFWVTVGMNIIPILGLIGIIEIGAVGGVQEAWSGAVANVAGAITAVLYIWSRRSVKIATANANAARK